MDTAPPQEVLDAINGTVTRWVRRVEIHRNRIHYVIPSELWKPSEEINILGGTVSVELDRTERRSLDLSLDNTDGSLTPHPDGLWYDKFIKVYRGVRLPSGEVWETLLGEFFIDTLESPHHPHVVNITARDRTKALISSKFHYDVTYPPELSVAGTVKRIAIDGTVPPNRIDIPETGQLLGREFVCRAGEERIKAMKELALSFGFDVFFDHNGIMRLLPFPDPDTDPPVHTFLTGSTGNIAKFNKTLNDSRLYNHIAVRGESMHTTPVQVHVFDQEDDSPTNVRRLGNKTFFHTSSMVTTYEQALELAQKLLKVYAQESFDLRLDALVSPWLEVGDVIEFIDPNPAPGDPVKYLLSSLTIPLGLEVMNAVGRRVTLVNATEG